MNTNANASDARRPVEREAIPASVAKLRRRLADIDQLGPVAYKTGNDPSKLDVAGVRIVVNDINASMDEIFGVGSANAHDFYVKSSWFIGYHANSYLEVDHFNRAVERVKAIVEAAIRRLEEWQSEGDTGAKNKILRAYEGLDLHPEIARAASDLYRDGHYSNAIEDAVKALNALVRLRSGEEGDGMPLMQTVFSPKNPVLRFNDLRDQSDVNEQTGFMMMFSGAVAGLRNPRAHSLIKDDPERALEFIAFVSLLAKLLDGAKKGPPPPPPTP
jgi:uncharacterized protein (TIGR02391 family)